jgi:hypothetical protein
MAKIKAMAKKYWWAVACIAFVIGAGSVAGAKNRAQEIGTNPKSVLK